VQVSFKPPQDQAEHGEPFSHDEFRAMLTEMCERYDGLRQAAEATADEGLAELRRLADSARSQAEN
jgi:hypothetical protein